MEPSAAPKHSTAVSHSGKHVLHNMYCAHVCDHAFQGGPCKVDAGTCWHTSLPELHDVSNVLVPQHATNAIVMDIA